MSSKEFYGIWAGFVAVIVSVFMAAWAIRGDIADNIADIADKTAENAVAIAELRTIVSANATAIAELRTIVSANATAIAELRAIVSANAVAIAETRGEMRGLQSSLIAHTGGHSHPARIAATDDDPES